MPALARVLEQIEPVYAMVPGWNCSTEGLRDFAELPSAAKAYLQYLEDRVGVEIGCISTGPERDQTILKPDSRLARLLG
jgi:adenylosuccinate synthase